MLHIILHIFKKDSHLPFGGRPHALGGIAVRKLSPVYLCVCVSVSRFDCVFVSACVLELVYAIRSACVRVIIFASASLSVSMPL